MSNTFLHHQPWLGKPLTEIGFIILPPFLCLLTITIFPQVFQNSADMPIGWWVILILLVDVAHVYSTLYKTYFDKNAVAQYRMLFQIVPVVAFVCTVLLYTISVFWFWRLLAYLAVYHFVRQQYGFMRIYSRKEGYSNQIKSFDKLVIYYATIYPIIYWHLHPDRNFNWFIEGDFWQFKSLALLQLFSVLYWIMLVLFVVKEIYVIYKYSFINIPRLAIIIGTILSWYFGIIYYNGDMAFTLLNVVSHGIPYMALIWVAGKPGSGKKRGILRMVYGKYGLILFLAIIFFFAFIEEGLWDAFLWKEHPQVFSFFYTSVLNANSPLLNFLIPLLALPQITHYILDGFIWKRKHNDIKPAPA